MGTRVSSLFRCLKAARFSLLLVIVGVAAASVIIDGTFVDNPAVFELDGNLAAGDTFGAVTGTRDWANSTLTASGLGGDVVATSAPEAGEVPAPSGFPYLLTDPAGVTIFTQGG